MVATNNNNNNTICNCTPGTQKINYNGKEYFCSNELKCCNSNNNCTTVDKSDDSSNKEHNTYWENNNKYDSNNYWKGDNQETSNKAIPQNTSNPKKFEVGGDTLKNSIPQNSNNPSKKKMVEFTKNDEKEKSSIKPSNINNTNLHTVASDSVNLSKDSSIGIKDTIKKENNDSSIFPTKESISSSNNNNINYKSNDIDNVSIGNISIDNSENSSQTINSKDEIKNSTFIIPHFCTLGFTVLGLALTVFFIVRKYKKRNHENSREFKEHDSEENYNNFPSYLLNDELKDATESCEEYLNTLSRLRYKEPSYDTYDPKNPFQQFSHFKESPVLAPSIILSSVENSPQLDYSIQSNMIESQYETLTVPSNQVYNNNDTDQFACKKASLRESQDSSVKIEISNLEISIPNKNVTPLLENESFLSSPISPNAEVSMNLSIINTSNIKVPTTKH